MQPPIQAPPAQPPPQQTTPTPAPEFAPAFHQALRWSADFSSITTLRMKVPLARAGQRVRVTFRAGDNPLQIIDASLSRVASDGEATDLVSLSFGGARGVNADTRELVTSDAVDFPVAFDDEVYVSVTLLGSAAQSYIDAFPGSFEASGDQAQHAALENATDFEKSTAVATVEVEAATSRVFLAIGDSITEGYTSGSDDYRNNWTHGLEARLGLPVANSGVSGQGVDDELAHLDAENLTLEHVTDCIVLLGTNDLGSLDAPTIEARLSQIEGRLAPFCRVWGATLLPRERQATNMQLMEDRREQINAWLKSGDAPFAGIVDFEAAVEAPNDPTHFAPGMDEDGIHPTPQGYAAMADFAAAYFASNSTP